MHKSVQKSVQKSVCTRLCAFSAFRAFSAHGHYFLCVSNNKDHITIFCPQTASRARTDSRRQPQQQLNTAQYSAENCAIQCNTAQYSAIQQRHVSIRCRKLRRQRSSMSLTIEYVQSLPRETVNQYALRYLISADVKKRANRVYSQTEKAKARQRRYYYRRHNIYHPALNPTGAVEKRWKRPTGLRDGVIHHEPPQDSSRSAL